MITHRLNDDDTVTIREDEFIDLRLDVLTSGSLE
jgi:hypothetical protein